MENKTDALYSNSRGKDEYIHISKIILTYIGIVALWLYTVYIYKAFGSTWLLPAISVMWIMGSVTAYKVPEERDSTIKETKYTILSYCLLLILYRWILQKITPITSSELGASLNIGIPSASGMAAAGLLQNALIWLSLMIPIGYLGWCGKKFKVFRGRQTKEEKLQELKGFNSNRRIR